MNRRILFSLASFLFCFLFTSNLNAQEGVYSFDKRIAVNANGLHVEIQDAPEYVESAIRSKFEKLGYKKPKSMKKGLYMYEAVVMPKITDATLNYYFRVEKSDKSSNSSIISFFLSPGNDNFWSSEKFPEEMKRAEQMLYNLDTEIATLKMQEKIIAQKEMIAKAEKDEKDLQNNEEDMVKKIAKLEKEIEDTKQAITKNKEDQVVQAQLIEQEKEKLAKLLQDLQDLINQ